MIGVRGYRVRARERLVRNICTSFMTGTSAFTGTSRVVGLIESTFNESLHTRARAREKVASNDRWWARIKIVKRGMRTKKSSGIFSFLLENKKKEKKLLLFLREINLKRRRCCSRCTDPLSKCEKRGVHKSGLTGSSFRFRNVYRVHVYAWTSLSNPLIGSAF